MTKVNTSKDQLTGEKMARGEVTTKVSSSGRNVRGLFTRGKNVLCGTKSKGKMARVNTSKDQLTV
jgi:hypothetical protein